MPSELQPDYTLSTAIARGMAELKGFHVVVANDKTLCLDIDSRDQFQSWEISNAGLLDLLKPTSLEHWRSKNGNLHVIAKLNEPACVEARIAWQSVLGSDPRREALSLLDVKAGEPFPVMLFRPVRRLTT